MKKIKAEDIVKGIDSLVQNDSNRVDFRGWSWCYITKSYGNCKHFHIDNIGTLAANMERNPEILGDFKKVIASFCHLTFSVNVTNKRWIDFLAEHFQLINYSAIPTGYGQGYQFHAIFFTNYDRYSGKAGYVARVNRGETFGLNTDKTTLLSVLKRIKGYKSSAWRNKFIDKLLANGGTL